MVNLELGGSCRKQVLFSKLESTTEGAGVIATRRPRRTLTKGPCVTGQSSVRRDDEARFGTNCGYLGPH